MKKNNLTLLFLSAFFCTGAVDAATIVNHNVPKTAPSVFARYYCDHGAVGRLAVFVYDICDDPSNVYGFAGVDWTDSGQYTGFYPAGYPLSNYQVAWNPSSITSSESTSLIQIKNYDFGLYFDTDKFEQLYNPYMSVGYTWPTSVYPFDYPSSNPRLQLKFKATIKKSSGTAIRHSKVVLQFFNTDLSLGVFRQFYIYDSRPKSLWDTRTGIDQKINKAWFLTYLGHGDNYYNGRLANSDIADNNTWNHWKTYGVDFSWNHFIHMMNKMIADGKIVNHPSLFDKRKWRLRSVNMNIESRRGAPAKFGGRFRELDVWTKY